MNLEQIPVELNGDENFKRNINKLDSSLKKVFENVSYEYNPVNRKIYITSTEPTDIEQPKGFQFITTFDINEMISYNPSNSNLYTMNNTIGWAYSYAPNRGIDNPSFYITKRSSMENISFDFMDILKGGKFASTYMESLSNEKEEIILTEDEPEIENFIEFINDDVINIFPKYLCQHNILIESFRINREGEVHTLVFKIPNREMGFKTAVNITSELSKHPGLVSNSYMSNFVLENGGNNNPFTISFDLRADVIINVI